MPVIVPDASLPVIALWTLAAILLYCVAYEMTAGLEREKLRNQLPHGRDPGAVFVGLSTSAEPRIFANSGGNSYHYDLGIANLNGNSLLFRGARCSFALRRSQVLKTWIAPGPPHWSPRKAVCIEYQLDDGSAPAVISMQSLERWFWPQTEQAANYLLMATREWAAGHSQELDPIPAAPPPREPGAAIPKVPFKALWKPIGRSCVISMAASSVLSPLLLLGGLGLSAFQSVLVTATVSLFIYSPHLRSSQTIFLRLFASIRG